MRMQSGGGIKGPSVTTPGSTVDIDVSDGSSTVTVMIDTGPATKYQVGHDGKVHIPVPANAKPGSQMHIRGNHIPPSYLRVEIMETQP
jgi:hypothetical protein